MNIKTSVNKKLLFFGIDLIVISEVVRFFLPEIDMNSVSPWEVYQQATVVQFWAGVAIFGWSICFIWLIVYLIRKQWLIKTECKLCRAKIKSKDDIFCRQCGTKLNQKDSIEGIVPASRKLM